MSAYQKIVALQDEFEKMTGLRPHIDIHFHDVPTDEQCLIIRNDITESSGGRMSAYEHFIEDDPNGKWTAYKSSDHYKISVTAYGPAKNEANSAAS